MAAPARDRARRPTHGDEWAAAVSPDGAEVAYVFTPRADLNRSEIRVADARDRRGARAHRHAADAGPRAGVVARRRDARLRVRALGRAGRCTSSAATATGERQLTDDGADYGEPRLAPGRRPHRASRAASRNRFGLAVVDAGTGRGRELAARRRLGRAAVDRRRRRDRDLRGPRHAAASCALVAPRPARRATLLAPAPLAVRRAPHVSPEDVTFRSRDGLEIPALPVPPARARRRTRPAPAIVYPHGGPTDAYVDDWDGHAQYFVDKGYAWLAVNFRGSTGYGRDVRARATTASGASRTCGTASPPPTTCARSTGSTATGSAIFGASYGSYMALLVGHRRPRAPLPLRGREVRRLRHPHVLGAGRPRGRPGPRADDGPPVDARARPTAPARRSTGSSSRARRC